MDASRSSCGSFFGGGAAGFFVEVGANRPQFASQTWHLEQLGWTGVLIEPQPDLAAAAAASARRQGVRGRLLVAGQRRAAACRCMSPARCPRSIAIAWRPGPSRRQVIDVPVRTLDDILAEAAAPPGFDLLSVDVEGHELEVLSGFDFARWRPRLILLEDHVGNLARHRFLKAAGYRLIRRFENNGWYVPQRRARSQVGWRERWEIVRKYYLGLPFRIARNASRSVRRRLRARLD